MFSFLLPRYVREGRNVHKDATKLLAYKRDIWRPEVIAEFQSHLDRLKQALRDRHQAAAEDSAAHLERICSENLPPPKDAGMRENVEVFLVAIVIALGVRTYFLQPFTIPTGSMQPTLNGILGYRTEEPPPNILLRVVQGCWLGRSYLDVVAKDDCTIVGLREFKSLLPFVPRTPLLPDSFGIFSRTELISATHRYVVNEPADSIMRYFAVPPGTTFKAGEPIIRGYVETGDHVFVDKMSYHFRTPRRGEVFVFNTQKVPTNENRRDPDGPSQFYIKRLAGLPGDELRIARPELFVNGKPAEHPAFRRVVEQKEPGYAGYGNGRDVGFFSGILADPETSYVVPPKNYFALGDNSFHSSDSRDWGSVPEQNLMGCGVFVYWPFTRHWGFIR